MPEGERTEEPTLLSVVVPVYSGASYLEELCRRVAAVREGWARVRAPVALHELILVDDNAIDESPELLDRLSAERDWVRVLHLSRNYGQHPATIAGILHSSGDWVATLDEDLQHPPEQLEAMLRLAVSEERDIVYAAPKGATHKKLVRDLGSRLYKRLISVLAGNRNVSLFNSFRMLRGSVARAASSVCGHETYFDVALSWFSLRVGLLELEIVDERVSSGQRSGYSFRKLLSHARRLLLSAQVKTLRAGALIGVLAMSFGFLFASYITAQELLFPGSFGQKGWGSLMVVNLVFGGAALFLIGAVLEYLAVLVLRAQGKPVFFVIDRSGDARIAEFFGRGTAP